MSEDTKTELKLPAAYVRPSLAEFTSPEHGYKAEDYESFFRRVEEDLAAAYAAGEVTDDNFVDIRDPDFVDEMTDADHDGLPDVLHVKSQVRAVANRTLRARQPTRHRFKQYLFADPSLRLVRRRPLRVPADKVRANLDELLEKEAAGILSVHAPNGQRIDLKALKEGRVVMSAATPEAPLPTPPLDSAANDLPAGESMPQHLGGSFIGDPAAARVAQRMVEEKTAELDRKNAELPPGPDAPPALPPGNPETGGEVVDPAAARVEGSTEKVEAESAPASTEEAVPPTAPAGEEAKLDEAAAEQEKTPDVANGEHDTVLMATELDPAITREPKHKGKKGRDK